MIKNKSIFKVLLIAVLICMSVCHVCEAATDKPLSRVCIYSGSSGSICWNNATDVEIHGNMITFKDEDGKKVTLVNCMTVISEQ